MATRVWKLSGEQKRQYRTARDEAGLNNQDWMTLAITGHLHQIQDELLAVGLGDAKDGDQPVKLLLDDTVVDALTEASEKVGVAAIVLARLCIGRQVGMSRVDKPKRARKCTGRPSDPAIMDRG